MNRLIEHLRRSSLSTEVGRTDGELLDSFLDRDDGAALESLIRRHGPMVWGVCRRALRGHQDAEDAYQATFLVLVQKAATLPDRATVGNWLYGVAHQTAVRMRDMAIRRGSRERQVTVMPEPTTADEYLWNDLRPVLDEELSRLPNKYRLLIVLCDLEGCTRKEVAGRLSIPEGTVASRLATAREMLAKRLTGRGVVVSGPLLGTMLSTHATSAGVPASVVTSAINVATLLAAGKAAGVISGPVATLTQGVLKTMFLKKILTTAMAVLALGVVVITGGSLAVGQTESKPAVGKDVKALVAEKTMKPAAKPAAKVAWGKEKNGLQLGLVLVPGDTTVYRPGQVIEFGVRVRNVSKEKITISIGLPESTPTITDALGEKVHVVMPLPLRGIVIPIETVLQPGETFDLHNRKVAVEEVLTGEAEQKGHVGTPTMRGGPGKYKIAFPEFVQRDLVLSTGQIEFEVKDSDEKKQPEQKEPFTVWGKEVGGLQAGLGFKAGDERKYLPGSKVELEYRLRNVSKADVTITYGAPREHSPDITNAQGDPVWVTMPPLNSYLIVPSKQVLKPGETVTLYKPEVALEAELLEKPVGPEEHVSTPTIRVGPGKYMLKFGGVVTSHPKLATGTAEFEVKAANEPFTAWGKEVGGLQVGLGFKVGEKRTYTHGETVKFVVRIRNVGKETVLFRHILAFFVENPPAITDADGKRVQVVPISADGFSQLALSTKVEPNKEVDLYEWKYELATKVAGKGERRIGEWPTILGTGKFSLQCTRVVGPTRGNPVDPNPTMEKLATGKLELEVKEAPAEMPKVLTPEEAIRIAGDGEPTKKFNAIKPAVEFKVEFVTKAVQVKADNEKRTGWVHGHSPDDVCLGAVFVKTDASSVLAQRFVATLTGNAIKQFNKVGITDLKKHFKGKTIRVSGLLAKWDYRGLGAVPEVEIVLDDMSQLEVVK